MASLLAPMETDTEVPMTPNMELPQLVFLLQQPDDLVPNKAEVREKLLAEIKAKDMAPYYDFVCSKFKWQRDEALFSELTRNNEKKLEELKQKTTVAQESAGETEVYEGLLAVAEYYSQIGNKSEAQAAFAKTAEKTVGLGGKIDAVFTQIRLGLFWNENDVVKKSIESANKLVEQGGDWDRRNRLKIYEGIQSMLNRDFKNAAERFLDTIATFTSTEMFTYPQFVFYTIVCSVMTLDRVQLKEKVIYTPEILGVIDDLPHLHELLDSLYQCRYAAFLRALVGVTEALSRDRMLAQHAIFWNREMRIRAYAQFLESYKSVTVASMAKAFGVSVPFLDAYV
eukprot:TRINITY_DN1492_c0_g1_i1.p1 TRINITY_DN1492_c0_g1~~TRINITY_DN1492_c0_g1_i1.p1  ORF type:complete len:355 (-),score=69.76 TRINITY_DN1492_c0_g1_i1:1186-2205(-)